MPRTYRFWIIVAAASLWMAAAAIPALADNVITACNQFCKLSCSGQGPDCREGVVVGSDRRCILGKSVVCSPSQDLKLYDGTDLDMAGRNLECQTGADCGDGVTMLGFGSRVFSTDPTTEAIIRGNFWSAVQCNNKTSSQVEGIAVEQAFSGMTNCQIVKNNVIRKAGRFIFGANHGILAVGVTTTGADLIEGNYIEDRVVGITFGAPAAGKGAILTKNNVVHTGDRGACGIWVQSTAKPIAQDNSFLSVGVPFFGLDGVFCFDDAAPLGTYARNLCDKDHPRCAACQAKIVGGQPVCSN